MIKKWWLFFAMIFISLSLACGSLVPNINQIGLAGEPEPTDITEPTLTSEPTDTPEPTETLGPQPDIAGVLDPWNEKTPIEGRFLALCLVSETEDIDGCVLSDSYITTGSDGSFEFFDVAPGTYMILYDSGASSFEEGMDIWGGKAIQPTEGDWCDTYFEPYMGDSEWIALRIPQGAEIEPDNMKAYGQFTLGLGDSPFIIAHELGETIIDNQMGIKMITVDVVSGETADLILPIAYYGD